VTIATDAIGYSTYGSVWVGSAAEWGWVIRRNRGGTISNCGWVFVLSPLAGSAIFWENLCWKCRSGSISASKEGNRKWGVKKQGLNGLQHVAKRSPSAEAAFSLPTTSIAWIPSSPPADRIFQRSGLRRFVQIPVFVLSSSTQMYVTSGRHSLY